MSAAEDGFETVFHFGINRTVLGVQNQIIVLDGYTISPMDVFPRQRHKEDHGAVAIGEGVKDIQGENLSIDAYSVEKAILLFKTEVFEGFQGSYQGLNITTVQIPPESPRF
jgi:hypothetical protein